MRDVSTVLWPDGRELRTRAHRRTARRRAVIGSSVAVVLVMIGAVWSAGSWWPDPSTGPADRWPFTGAAPEMLRGADVGPGYRVNAWGTYDSSSSSPDDDDRVPVWPSPWLDGCPALQREPAVGFRNHRGGSSVRADPPLGSTAASVDEYLLRMADPGAASSVLAESRRIAESCPVPYTVGNRLRYTVRPVLVSVVGDDAFGLELTEEGYDATTGARTGMPAHRVFVLHRVGRVVILLTPSKPVDVEWLQDVARAAVRRLCAGSDEC
jgi:hypothetical protein